MTREDFEKDLKISTFKRHQVQTVLLETSTKLLENKSKATATKSYKIPRNKQ